MKSFYPWENDCFVISGCVCPCLARIGGKMEKYFSKIITPCFISFLLLTFINHASSGATLKKLIAVSNFENKTSYKGQVSLDDGMADQLTDALIQSGQFIVLERQTLSDVMGEQDLAASGRAAKSTTAKTGAITSAQILVKGTITEFEEQSAGSGMGIGIKEFGLGTKRSEAHVGIIIRLIDTTTGQVLDSKRVEGKAEAGGLSWGAKVGGVVFGTEGFSKTPLGKAVQIAIDNAVAYIAEKMKFTPFQGRVVTVKEGVIYISAGANTGVNVGDTFAVYSKGEELIDPETGEILGSEEERIGSVKVIEVKEKFSKVVALDGKGFKSGDIIRQN